MNIKDLPVESILIEELHKLNYTQATPIQEAAIPAVMQGRDLLASAQTGSGKTVAFALPILDHLIKNPHKKGRHPLKALVLLPTRELALQVAETFNHLSQGLELKIATIYGGVAIAAQTRLLKTGVDIIIATPGRLMEHIEAKNVHLSSTHFFVLDEADRMLDMGFIADIKKIMSFLPKKRQNMLFSATYSPEIKALSQSFLHHPLLIEIGVQNSAAEQIKQRFIKVDKDKKAELLSHLIERYKWEQVLVFMQTKFEANRLMKLLDKLSIHSAVIHGNKSQNARIAALEGFKKGEVRVLVATDIAARGLDIQDLPQVVNFELPDQAQDYVHRIGRTGRAGKSGESISLVSIEEQGRFEAIEALLGQKFKLEMIEGYGPRKKALPVREGLKMDGISRYKDGALKPASKPYKTKNTGFERKKKRPEPSSGGRKK